MATKSARKGYHRCHDDGRCLDRLHQPDALCFSGFLSDILCSDSPCGIGSALCSNTKALQIEIEALSLTPAVVFYLIFNSTSRERPLQYEVPSRSPPSARPWPKKHFPTIILHGKPASKEPRATLIPWRLLESKDYVSSILKHNIKTSLVKHFEQLRQ